ncbi:MAG: hypothetical protein AAB627_01310 [Patescibacteria group bacterium]
MPLDFQLLQTFSDLELIISLLASFKWIVLPILAFFALLIVRETLLFSSQSKYKSKIEWDIFEIRVPREIKKGPKAMEQFFVSLWTLFNIPTGWKEKYIDGEVTRWHSFEIVGSGGTIHFYIRTPKILRHSVESMLYAQYPDIEITDAEDYTLELPNTLEELKKIGYDLFGTEIKLKNPAPNPINTYMAFEEKGGEERIIDPISVILELLSKLRPEEKAWIQLIVRPVTEWQKEGEEVMKEIREKAILKPPARPGVPQPTISLSLLTPAEEEKLKAVSRKVSKQGFDTLIRHLYLAPKDIFNRNMWKNLTAYFNQYSSSLNYFTLNIKSLTSARWYKWPYIFPKRRVESKKRKLLYRYKTRYIPEETFIGRLSDPNRVNMDKKSSTSILNTEELATLYHPPTNVVLTAPTLDRIESKKVSPPGYVPYE